MATDDDLSWQAPAQRAQRELDGRFVLTQAASMLGLIVGVVAVAWWIMWSAGIVRANGYQAGLLPLLAGVVSFAASFAVLHRRLVGLPRGRFVNGIAAAAVYAVGVGMAGVALLFAAANDWVVPPLAGSWLGAAVFAVMLSQMGVLLGAMMANAVLPERGPIPEGSRQGSHDPEYRL